MNMAGGTDANSLRVESDTTATAVLGLPPPPSGGKSRSSRKTDSLLANRISLRISFPGRLIFIPLPSEPPPEGDAAVAQPKLLLTANFHLSSLKMVQDVQLNVHPACNIHGCKVFSDVGSTFASTLDIA